MFNNNSLSKFKVKIRVYFGKQKRYRYYIVDAINKAMAKVVFSRTYDFHPSVIVNVVAL